MPAAIGIPRALRASLCLLLALQIAGCGGGGGSTPSAPAAPAPAPATPETPPPASPPPSAPPPPTTPDPTPPPSPPSDLDKALSAYLHDLSPRLDGVTAANARVEHYRIPTRDGSVLDSWVRRPPGEFGQPLVLVFTPYYGGGDPAQSPLGDPSLQAAEHLIPYGYAVGLVSVGGTGNSGGCFRNYGVIERQQNYDAAEFLAKQTWSNGAIAAIGLSYEGGSANDLFVSAPPSIKTVVPMQGVTDDYRQRFGTGAIARRYNPFYNTLIYPQVATPVNTSSGLGPSDPQGYLNGVQGDFCADQLDIQQQSALSQISADKSAYSDERDVITLLEGSPELPRPGMFFVHSFQDSVVEPNAADGYIEAVRRTGAPLHMWFGQWVHVVPQAGNCARGAPCRGDFWETALLAWFDQFLKGRDTGILDAPAVQLQADDGVWRHEESWPPKTDTLRLYPQVDGSLTLTAGGGAASYLDAGSNHVSELNVGEVLAFPQPPGASVEFLSAPLTAGLRLTGIPLFRTLATADGRRANVVVSLLERKADGSQRYLNFAALNLNHAESLDRGEDDISGKPFATTLRFYPQDNLVAAGSRLVLHVAGDIETTRLQSGNPDNLLNYGMNVLPVSVGANVRLDLSSTELVLPRNTGDRIEPLPWASP